MATQQDRYQFPALRRRLTLLQQELYEAEKLLDINRATNDSGNMLMRYQMLSGALSEEIDELTWILHYADTQIRIPYQWPWHYWLFFAVLAGVSVGLTGLLLLRLGGGG
jgi:hypothetical protein